jgi:predicted GNAT family acetyltransferase
VRVDISVADRPEASRYEARTADGTVAGFAAYELQGSMIVMTHTEVEPAYEGQGVGSTLIRQALDDVRRRSLQLVPLCPFVAAFLERHPEYADLVHLPPRTG